MREADLDQVAAAEQALYEFPWTRGNFRDSLLAGYSAWVCRDGSVLAGYTVMVVCLDEAHLLNVSVLEAYQGQGLGRSILESLLAIAREGGAQQMYLEVRPSNERAQHLYRSMGFQPVGRRRGYYPAREGREDAIVMVLAL